MKPITQNTLFYGDNLQILREHIPDESVDLIYLDPPFNSNRTYNVLFKDESGKDSEAQITAFEDTWHWDRMAEDTYHELITESPGHISSMIGALRGFIGTNQMMAYLVMMTIRLIELHRVLKSTGSLYLHCDPTASHYLKIIMDGIWGAKQFRNEIVWDYSFRLMDLPRFYNRKHDIILFYSKDKDNFFQMPKTEWTKEDLIATRKQKIHVDENGVEWIWMPGGRGHSKNKLRRVDEIIADGKAISDVWQIPIISSSSKERLGYPTQKPLALLERIIQASSSLGDWTLDPFCGCGTAIAAAQKLNRRWIGIDITHLSVSLQKYRLNDMLELTAGVDYRVIGEPKSLSSANQLANDNRYQFQWWALSLVRAKPLGGQEGSKTGKKGKDKGIDGVINFIDEQDGKPKRVLVQVKSGKVKSGDIRDLRGTVEREDAAIGIFITLDPPTKDMKTEAVSAGYYHSEGWNKNYPKIQILTIEELLKGAQVEMPPVHATFKQAKKESEGDPIALINISKKDSPKDQQKFF